MTSLEAIGFTIAGGSVVTFLSLGAFGFAVKHRHRAIAPRCTARPKDTIYNPRPLDKAQYRGNPWTGWIPWTLGLSYETMLNGVPGTGTRKNGKKGALLNVNLDGIILFRFNAFCVRVALLATILVIGIILPINWTANPNYNEINFNRTTIANIPALGANVPNVSSADIFVPKTFFEKLGKNLTAEPDIQIRLYIIVFCSWILTYYVCIEIGKEWKDNLALRRKYYFEADHHQKRKHELKRTLLRSNECEGLESRDPWIPHPEQRDTVPNVELYSVLVGNLPSLPSEVVNEKDMEETMGFTEQQKIDWQLAVATTFFDHCVPNQPGFSSSVAAVTILPDAKELAAAWRKWYEAAAALRRLRFIRSIISDRRYFDIEDVEEGESQIKSALEEEMFTNSSGRNIFTDDDFSVQQSEVHSMGPHQKVQFFREFYCNEEVETQFMQALNIGPEQTAVYSREFAQGAANCCPNGCREERLMRSRIDELLEMEREAIIRVQEANKVLRSAQTKAGGFNLNGDTTHSMVNANNDNIDISNNGDTDLLDESLTPRTTVESLTRKSYKGSLQMEAELLKKHSTSPILHEFFRSRPSVVNHNYTRPEALTNAAQSKSLTSIHISDYNSKNHHSSLPNQTNKSKPHLSAKPNSLPNPSSGNDTKLNGSDNVYKSLNFNAEGKISLQANELPEFLPNDNVTTLPIVESASTKSNQSIKSLKKLENHVSSDGDSSSMKLGSYYNKHRKDGVWRLSLPEDPIQYMKDVVSSTFEKIFYKRVHHVVNEFHRNSTFAVVTFTSRQAAVAARHCLADGRGANRWIALDNIPVPPLADVAPCDFITCRGCCRPITLSIPKQQQVSRRWLTIVILLAIYVFYTIPITLISNLFNIEQLIVLFPGLYERVYDKRWFQKIFSGIVPAALQSLFFSVCPMIFKAIANFGSTASSVSMAEFSALKYYWWFMFCIAFTGSTLATVALNALSEGQLAETIPEVIKAIADTIPVQISSIWLNWIILRFTIILPFQYLLQFNTFLFLFLRWNCCARCVMGGGVGGPLPYRIYVDGGTVFMCIVALSLSSPLIAPFAFIYFIFCEPIWRRNSIYLYRPKYDGGGFRWPFLSDICFSSIFLGQVLLTTLLSLKNAIGPATFCALAIVPTFMFRKLTRARYYRSYCDSGLLQTSLLDMWDASEASSMKKREEFRRFLVDAHKAAYIPVCIGGAATNTLTTEPAVVLPIETDSMTASQGVHTPINSGNTLTPGQMRGQVPMREERLNLRSPVDYLDSDVPVVQRGMSFRRAGSSRQLVSTNRFSSPNAPSRPMPDISEKSESSMEDKGKQRSSLSYGRF